MKDFVPSPYGLAISGLLFILQVLLPSILSSYRKHVYDAAQLVTEIEGAISNLSTSIRSIQVTQGFSQVLDEGQLDEVYCAAVALSASVTEYLTKAILCLEGNLGITPALIDLTMILVRRFLESDDFANAKKKIDSAAETYKDSMGYLTVTMTTKLLHNDKDDKRGKMIEWLWKGDFWKLHKQLRGDRITNTGNWILELDRFKEWRQNEGNQTLICLGICKPHSDLSHCSWGWEVHPYVSSFPVVLTMRSIVIDSLLPLTNTRNRKKVEVIFFYFDRHDRNFQTADDFVRSCLQQLIYQVAAVPSPLEKAYDAVQSKGKSAEPERERLVGLLAECLESFSSLFLLIDGFDKCAYDERPKIISDLQQLPQSKLRLYLTGRTVVFDSRNLRNENVEKVVSRWLKENFLEIHSSQEDIQKYLRFELEKGAVDFSQTLKNKIVDTISD